MSRKGEEEGLLSLYSIEKPPYGRRPKVLISIFDTNHFGYQTAPTHPGTLTKATTNSLRKTTWNQ